MFLLLCVALLSTLSNADEKYKWVQVGADINGVDEDDYSGGSVSMSADGSILAIGAAAGNAANGDATGHVRVFENQAGTWVQMGANIDGEGEYGYAGKRLSMNADGTMLSIANGAANGQIRVYENQSGSWVKNGEFEGEADYDYLGPSSLSDTGSRIAIGASGNDGNGKGAGHVRVFEFQSGSWVQMGSDIDGEAGDSSGWSVSMSADGSKVAIGATGNTHDGNGNDAGQVRVYELQSGSWVQMGAAIDGEAEKNNSGECVVMSADGSRVAIAAQLNNGVNGDYSGHVRVFEFQSGSWVQMGADIDGEAANDYSGKSVAMSADGSVVVIGASDNDGPENSENIGHVRIFDFQSDTGSWVQAGADIDGEAADDQSGTSVAMSDDGNIIAIGAPSNAENGKYSGHVRVFKRDPPLGRVHHKSSNGYNCPGSAAWIYASCTTTSNAMTSCSDVMDEMRARVAGQAKRQWHDPHLGVYSITGSTDNFISMQRVTRNQKYTDKMNFTFEERARGVECQIKGCSESQVTSIADFSTNYCNLRMMYCGKSDGCIPVVNFFDQKESEVKPSTGAGKDASACLQA